MTPLGLNDLRRGSTYLAATSRGWVLGEYLGMETPHGDHAILLRHAEQTESIPLASITSIGRAAR